MISELDSTSEFENRCQQTFTTLRKIGQKRAFQALSDALFQADIVSQLVATSSQLYVKSYTYRLVYAFTLGIQKY